MNNKFFGVLLALSISACGGSSSSQTTTEQVVVVPTPTVPDESTAVKANILFILSDDQGLDASNQYNYATDLPTTPVLDDLANQGLVFDNVWATPACTTTRGSIITGQHGITSGISYVPATLDTSSQTLQRQIKSLAVGSDYQTAVIGKWHLGGSNPDLLHPNNSGVDYFAGTLGAAVEDYYQWPLTINGEQSISNEYHTSKITDLAIDWLELQNNAQTPWFLWLAYAAPHAPFHLPPEDLHSNQQLSGTQADINNNKRAYYLAAIEAMDSEIGRLIESLPTDIRDNTLIVFIGDNGTPNAVLDTSIYQQQQGKGTLFESGINVPMVVSGYGVSRMNEREAALINTTDFYATFSELLGSDNSQINNSYSFLALLSENDDSSISTSRTYNYSEFESSDLSGWTIRNADFKLIEYIDGTQQLFALNSDPQEADDLLVSDFNVYQYIVAELVTQAHLIRGESVSGGENPIDITNALFTRQSANCADYLEQYQSTVLDVNNSIIFTGALTISQINDKCVFQTNNIPNHDFNDGAKSFVNNVSEQNNTFEITAIPTKANSTTAISLQIDNAILLNGVKVDLLAAACFNVGDGKVGCNDINQPWRYDPMFIANGFSVDSHNAHTQPNGSYHYHGTPNALYNDDNNGVSSAVVGFAADGFPIFGPYFDDNGNVRKALSSYTLRNGSRANSSGNPGGDYDGTFRDDYEYQQGYGDLDECNGMTLNGVYGYFITETFPYILTCFKGTPDVSFNK